MNIVFMGTSDFACRCLQDILKSGAAEVSGVYIKPETSHGRRKNASPVKKLAHYKNIPVLAPASLKSEEAQVELKALNPGVIVVIDYGLILPSAILDFPLYGCINLHGSLLPFYRGAAPLQRCLMNGDEKTGVTVMFMNEKLDEGDIILKKEIPVSEEEDYFTLSEKLSHLGAEMIVGVIKDLGDGKKLNRSPQDHSIATLAPKIKKSEGIINWDEEAQAISQKVRALVKWPGCVTKMKLHGKEKLIKIFRAASCGCIPGDDCKPGDVCSLENDGLFVCSGKRTCLKIEKLQIEGKNVISAKDFVNGFQIHQGDIFF